MVSHIILTLDTQAPAAPELLINGGAARTGERDVVVLLRTADYEDGDRDVAQFVLWGDVDPAADPLVQPTEGASSFQTFREDYQVRLSDGSGRKHLYARLRDDVCNITLPFTDFIDLDLTAPVVTITTALDRARISKIAPCHQAVFSWQSSVPFDHYQVRVVPSTGSPYVAGVPIGTTYGSANTGDMEALATLPASTPITTIITGADLEAASPGNTDKIVKVFVRTPEGVWSP